MKWRLFEEFNHRERLAFYISLVVHVVIAWQSIGYYQSDEHFQILEFANAKLGFSSQEELPWEFAQKIRPTLQPTMVYGLGKILQFCNAYDPFLIAFFLRFVTSLLSWLATVLLAAQVISQLENLRYRYYFVLLANFLWFLPYFHARFSSETWSGLFFFFAFYQVLELNRREGVQFVKSLLVGVFFGVAFWCRFQIAFAMVGLSVWLLFFQRKTLIRLLPALLSFGVCVWLFSIMDTWFYGESVFTPYRYYTANITNDVASNWGVSPWWAYFTMFIETAAPPLSIFVLIGFLFSIYTKPKSIFIWPTVLFVVAHMAVPHKEIRFLAPVIFLLPWSAMLFLTDSTMLGKIERLPVRYFTIAKWLALMVNVPLLIGVVFLRPAEEAASFYKFVYQVSKDYNVRIISVEGDPYRLGAGLPANFYKPKNLQIVVTDQEHLQDELSKSKDGEKTYLFSTHFSLPEQIAKQSPGYECKFRTIPSFLKAFNFNGWVERTRVMSLYELSK